MMLSPNPTQPMIKTSLGSSIPAFCSLSDPHRQGSLISGGLTLDSDESLNGLQEDADPQGKQKHAIEEGAEELGPLPAEGEALAGLRLF